MTGGGSESALCNGCFVNSLFKNAHVYKNYLKSSKYLTKVYTEWFRVHCREYLNYCYNHDDKKNWEIQSPQTIPMDHFLLFQQVYYLLHMNEIFFSSSEAFELNSKYKLQIN